MSEKVLIDPPSGWMYGFPQEVELPVTPESVEALLRKFGYPEEDIPFAMKHMRYIYQ